MPENINSIIEMISLDSLLTLFKSYPGYIIFFGLFLENAAFLGLIIPGVSILVITGFFLFAQAIDPVHALAAAYFGTLLGDNVNYLLGYYGVGRLPWVQRQLSKNPKVSQFFSHNSLLYYSFYHFPPYLRTVFPLTLGANRFPLGRWFLLEAIAVPLFIMTFILLGYLLGAMSRSVENAVAIGNYTLIFFSIFFAVWTGIIIYQIWRKRREKKRRED
jgi:membrane protein DedA with SNARE-associated domain